MDRPDATCTVKAVGMTYSSGMTWFPLGASPPSWISGAGLGGSIPGCMPGRAGKISAKSRVAPAFTPNSATVPSSDKLSPANTRAGVCACNLRVRTCVYLYT